MDGGSNPLPAIMPNSHRDLCERCGGYGIQEAGRYWDNNERKFVDKDRITCETCDGEGYLGPKLEMVILKLQIDCGDPEYFEYNGPNAEDAARWRVEKAKQDNTKQGKRDVRAWIVTVEPTSGGWHVIA